jgi:uncharacterized protein
LNIEVGTMLRKTLFALAVVASVALGPAFAADPTLHEVYRAAEAGNYREAQAMMDQVLRDHPNSAKAHFVEAELLAKQGRLASAQTELAIAERLDPGLSFASPRAVQELKARLASSLGLGQPAARVLPSSTSGGFPWGPLLLVLGLVAVIAFVVSRLRQSSTNAAQRSGLPTYGGGAGPAQPYGAGGVGPVAPPAGGMGSGILGGLATGAAVGAGVVAGEALMHRVLDGHRSEEPLLGSQGGASEGPQQPDDMGGSDFGVADGSSWDDSSVGGGDDWT